MTPREWIDYARAAGFTLELTRSQRPEDRPFVVGLGEGSFGSRIWATLSTALPDVGIGAVADELRRDAARAWITAVRDAGLTVALNETRTAQAMPVLVYNEEGRPTGSIWRDYAPDLVRIGLDTIADELRRERLH